MHRRHLEDEASAWRAKVGGRGGALAPHDGVRPPAPRAPPNPDAPARRPSVELPALSSGAAAAGAVPAWSSRSGRSCGAARRPSLGHQRPMLCSRPPNEDGPPSARRPEAARLRCASPLRHGGAPQEAPSSPVAMAPRRPAGPPPRGRPPGRSEGPRQEPRPRATREADATAPPTEHRGGPPSALASPGSSMPSADAPPVPTLAAGWSPRPGVDEPAAVACALLVQSTWRENRAHLRLARARRHLLATAAADVADTHGEEEGETTKKAPLAASGHRCGPASEPATLGPSEALWDEAFAFRQPSVQHAVQAQRRWLLQSEHASAPAQLEALSGQHAGAILTEMAGTEARLHLRTRASGAGAGSWRPPSAVGSAVCADLEQSVAKWRRRAAEGGAEAVLLPCLCLFQVIVAGSHIHRRREKEADQALAALEATADRALDEGFGGEGFMHAVANQFRARVAFQRARMLLVARRCEDAAMEARSAARSLEDRGGPRDFWPPHCWELAACHRIAALGFAGVGSWRKAAPMLSELAPLLAPMGGAQPGLVAALGEDLEATRLELDVAAHMDPRIEKWNAAAELQALVRRAADGLAEARRPAARAAALVLSSLAALVQELPWYVAGSARPEALGEVRAMLREARRLGLDREAVALKVLPLEAACAAMGGGSSAEVCAQTRAWEQESSACLGDDDEGTMSARRLQEALKAAMSGGSSSASGASVCPAKPLQQALRGVLACAGVGWRRPFAP